MDLGLLQLMISLQPEAIKGYSSYFGTLCYLTAYLNILVKFDDQSLVYVKNL
jgi:hypothetical protein